ncbi:flagellar hook-length control protein FliK [Paenibacillus shunpengii]|uniref:Flagellar hook-length control protein FliK n=1 Tax=Paenibacillus shunpengii TaxID=2054424 RepID=A0ABW5SM09_9BACL
MISFLPQMAMTQTVESTSSTLAGNSSGTGSSTQPSFLEQLQGLMGTTSSSGSSTSDVNQAGLFTLMAAAGMTAASEEEMNLALQDESELFAAAEQLIENLIKALEDSKEKLLLEDSELLADLNAWLSQFMNAYYPAAQEGSESSDSTSQQIVNILANDPNTIQYAVQEALQQVVEASGKKSSDGQALVQQSLHTELITSLKNLLQKSDISTESLEKLQVVTEQIATVVNMSSNKEAVIQYASSALMEQLLKAAGEDSTSTVSTTEDSNQVTDKEAGKLVPTEASKTSIVEETDSSASTSDGEQGKENEPTTAGQLVLRSGNVQTPVAKSEMAIPAGQFVKDMSEFVIQKFEFVKQNGVAEAVISLRPEHLGQVDVQLSMQNGQLVARFMTEQVIAKDLLEQQITQLRATLQAQGIQVERLEVTQNTSLSSHMYQDGGGSNGQSGGERRSREREQRDEDAIQAVEMQDELRTWMREQQGLEVFPSAERTQGFTAKA